MAHNEYMAQRNNTTNTVEIRFEDGEVFGEQRRNTIGGHANMIRRIEARIGETVNARSNGDTVEFFTPSGRTFVVAQVQTFAGAR